jgi:hypothetical protein
MSKQEEKAINEDPEFQKTLMEKAKNYKENKKTEVKNLQATKELIFNFRGKRLFDIPVQIDDDTIITFKAKRLNEKERSALSSLRGPVNEEDIKNLTDAELADMQKEGYKLLSTVIVDPVMTPDEWEETDLALVQYLIMKASILQYEVNDGTAIKSFRI